MDTAKFRPVRGLEAKIQAAPITPGYVYFATDSKKIYLDTEDPNTGATSRILMSSVSSGGGGSGGNSGIFYGIREVSEDEAEIDVLTFTIANIEGDLLPSVDDLIINAPDSCFYRVLTTDNLASVTAKRLTVAGSGSGEGGSTMATVDFPNQEMEIGQGVFVEGLPSYLTVTPQSGTNKAGTPLDRYLEFEWSIRNNNDTSIIYASGTETVLAGADINFEFGTKLSAGTSSVFNQLWFSVTGLNSGKMKSPVKLTVQCVKLSLGTTTDFGPLKLYNTSALTMSCMVTGAIEKILVWKLDGIELNSTVLSANQTGRQTYIINEVSRGVHTARIELYQSLAGDRGAAVQPIEFEIAVRPYDATQPDLDKGNSPIIWTGNYKSVYNNYDRIIIPYMVYNPDSDTSVVRFYKNASELSVSPITLTYNSNSPFNELEIIDATVPEEEGRTAHNTYQIICGDTVREISFDVLQTGKMLLKAKDNLLVNFSSAGRSNKESSVTRPVWTYSNPKTPQTKIVGEFSGFNWYNNGWIVDSTGNTCLRISNGAKFAIPVGNITMNGTGQGQESFTFEFEFKIRNIQNYEKLISLITRYWLNDTHTIPDDNLYASFLASTRYNTYDEYLQANLPNEMYPNITYDDLEFRAVETHIAASTALCNYYDGTNGFCLGTQDAFFKTNVGTLTSNYVEDRIINLTLVYSKTKKLAYIYLNGVLDGAAKIPNEEPFTINKLTDKGKIVFNSDFCDIDLYKVRVYNTDFAVGEVLNNYAVDMRDVQMYNESNDLVRDDVDLQSQVLDYDAMIAYNQAHPDEYLMPYILFSNVETHSLPYSKQDEKTADMTFVNTGLDHDYATGALNDAAASWQPANIRVAWITPNEATRLAEEYPSTAAQSNYYIENSDKSKTYLDINYNIIEGKGGFSAVTHKLSKKVVNLVDEATGEDLLDDQGQPIEDPDKSCSICLYRTISPVANYYLHHGASFVATKGEIKTQGTSSQFYPRRNYKYKGKGVMFANKGPFELDPMYMEYFFMDNPDVGTTKFTLKIDYMESSGSYNTGFANLVNNAYTKHPLFDYDFADNLNISNLRTSIQGFPTMAFHEKQLESGETTVVYIGRYNMNLDKGSDECFGYKLFVDNDPQGSKVKTRYAKNSKGKVLDVATAAECWELEDNNRGFCSFRHPKNVPVQDLMNYSPGVFFSVKDDNGQEVLNAKGTCPIIADSFEYRYSKYGDTLDYLYGDEGVKPEDLPDVAASMGVENVNQLTQQQKNEYVFDKYKNWEKACIWVYSTDTEAVGPESDLYISYGEAQEPRMTYYTTSRTFNPRPYEQAVEFDDSVTYYVYNSESNQFTRATTQPADAEAFVQGTYYILIPEYTDVLIYDHDTLTKTESEITEAITAAGFTESQLKDRYGIVDTENSTELVTVKKLVDDSYGLAYAELNGYTYIDHTVEDDTDYYHFDGGTIVSRSTVMTALSNDPISYQTNNIKVLRDSYGELTTYTVGRNTYLFDTKEYRLAKFANEFQDHFDLEYSCVYFIMTELFMCYDSRGKNAMFASWGPQKEGGEYIWYPLFYDIDTQLGINNTGIPSFEYYTNATKDGCFSTNDSVLWGNLYKCFLSTIRDKYQELRTAIRTQSHAGTAASGNHAPLAGIEYGGQDPIEHIENWYLCKPKTCNSVCMQGHRPLVAINMDEYYKYIFIMDTNAGGGYQGTSQGETLYDTEGSFLYALQGDRSLSRQQFLKRRLHFIDSWLTKGTYVEGGGSTFKLRVSANDPDSTSDIWIDSANNKDNTGTVIPALQINSNYYTTDPPTINPVTNDPIKSNELDADFFIKLTPYQRDYVTLATDNAPIPSIEFTGAPVRVEFPSNVVSGVRKSPRYAEQLLYIYGADYMKDIGDISLLYPREFEARNATHMQKLILGNDTPGFKNWKLKSPVFDAEGGSATGKPLLKEVVFTNVKLDGEGIYPLDFGSAEKLQIFRALGMNLSTVSFANGVALHTLHLPSSITKFVLKEARYLTDIISNYITPTKDQNGDWQAQRGLYIQGLTDLSDESIQSASTPISHFEIIGGSLGYNSYDLLKKLYTMYESGNSTSENLTIGLEDINWTPYSKLEKGYVYDSSEAAQYYIDNEHYQLEALNEYNGGTYANIDFTVGDAASTWAEWIRQGKLYIKDTSVSAERIHSISDDALTMLVDLATDIKYKGTDTSKANLPVITGNIYIDNDTNINESYIKNTVLDMYYPNLNIFVAKVNKAYSAKFIKIDGDNYEVVGTQKVDPEDVITKPWFSDPYTSYASLTSRDHYDFNGWSTAEGDTTKVLAQALYQANAYYTYDQATKTYSIDSSETFNSNKTYYNRDQATNKYSVIILTDDSNKIWNNQHYTEGIYEYNFYIIYQRHKYLMTYLNMDASVITTQEVPYGDYLVQPAGIPAAPAAALNALSTFQTYRFLGYNNDSSATVAINLHDIAAADNYTFHAIYHQEEVHENVYPEEMFTFTSTSYDKAADPENMVADGWCISPKIGVTYVGKITIPLIHENKPVITIEGFSSSAGEATENLTHVFFQRAVGTKLRAFNDNAFSQLPNLRYIEIPDTVRFIGAQAFVGDSGLNITDFGQNVYWYGNYCFANALLNNNSLTNKVDIAFPGCVRFISTGAFNNLGTRQNTTALGDVTLGSSSDKSQISQVASDAFTPRNSDRIGTSLTIFVDTSRLNEVEGLVSAQQGTSFTTVSVTDQ